MVHIVYNFISYNRRVIAAKQVISCNFNCAPEFNKTWRMAYIIFAIIISTLIFKSIIPLFVFPIFAAFAHHFAIIGFKNKQEKQYTFTGYLVTSLLIAALLYLPFKLVSTIFNWPLILYIGFVIVSTIAIKEFKRRWIILRIS